MHVYTDGSVLVNHGGTEMGQGLNTKVAQVVAHELAIDFDAVRVHGHRHAEGGQHLGHRGLDRRRPERQGGAGRRAADPRAAGGLRRQAARRAGRRRALCQRPRQRGRQGAGVRRAGAGRPTWRACSCGATASTPRPACTGTARRLQGKPFFYFAYGAAVSEVVVDTLTGEYRLLRADVLHDVGTSLNPAIDIGQVEGAFIQGMGWLTMEELVWHPKTGALLTHAPSTYKIPTANDCPPHFDVRAVRARRTRPTASTAARPSASRRCCCRSRCCWRSATRCRPSAATASIRRCVRRRRPRRCSMRSTRCARRPGPETKPRSIDEAAASGAMSRVRPRHLAVRPAGHGAQLPVWPSKCRQQSARRGDRCGRLLGQDLGGDLPAREVTR